MLSHFNTTLKFTLLILIIWISSCQDGRSPVSSAVTRDSVRKALADSIDRAEQIKHFDSLLELQRQAIGEPDIDTYHREVFRYTYAQSFGPTEIVRAERCADSSYILVSILILNGIANPIHLPTVPHRVIPDYFRGYSDSLILFADAQPLNKDDWAEFRQILDGSYYWTIKDPVFEVGPLDGDGLTLQSKSFWPRRHYYRDTLTYHANSIQCPLKGSFTDAFDYLAKKSRLFQKIKVPRVKF